MPSIYRGLMAGAALAVTGGIAHADTVSCPVIYQQLKTALTAADQAGSSGFGNHYWGVVVNRAGIVCAVAYSGSSLRAQFGGSDSIDLVRYNSAGAIAYHEAASGQGGTLVVTDGGNRFATHLDGTYNAAGFSLTASTDGAALHYAPPA